MNLLAHPIIEVGLLLSPDSPFPQPVSADRRQCTPMLPHKPDGINSHLFPPLQEVDACVIICLMPFWPSVLLAISQGLEARKQYYNISQVHSLSSGFQLGSASGRHWRRLKVRKKGKGIFLFFLLLVSSVK